MNDAASRTGREAGVRHDQGRGRFELELAGEVAHLDYQRRGDVLYAHHTEVPAAHRGHGVAGRLADALVTYAREQGLRITPACTFVSSYMRKHEDTHDLIASSGD